MPLKALFLVCQPIFKIFAAHFATNLMLNCAKKIFHLDKNSCKIFAKNHYQTLGNGFKLVNDSHKRSMV